MPYCYASIPTGLVGPPQIQVFATDLDLKVIREAREGLYPYTIAADVGGEERLHHYVIYEPGGYRVLRVVCELMLFAPHDELKDSPFSRLNLVSCRNLLIYLKREAQDQAFDISHFSLHSRTFLGPLLGLAQGVRNHPFQVIRHSVRADPILTTSAIRILTRGLSGLLEGQL